MRLLLAAGRTTGASSLLRLETERMLAVGGGAVSRLPKSGILPTDYLPFFRVSPAAR
jgi:hypothetical protein